MSRTVSRFAFAAGVVLAMAFTFSCAPPDDEGGGGGNGGSSTCSADFRTVTIDTQTWMAENLNCNVGGSKCYGNDPANCAKYGRLYDWSTAMGLPSSCNEKSCTSQIQPKHKGICPSGWHIPSGAEWDALVTFAGGLYGYETAGTKLKATSWDENGGSNGTDDYGFSALPGGFGFSDGSFEDVGICGQWLSSGESTSINTAIRYIRGKSNVYRGIGNKSNLFSVRCVQD